MEYKTLDQVREEIQLLLKEIKSNGELTKEQMRNLVDANARIKSFEIADELCVDGIYQNGNVKAEIDADTIYMIIQFQILAPILEIADIDRVAAVIIPNPDFYMDGVTLFLEDTFNDETIEENLEFLKTAKVMH